MRVQQSNLFGDGGDDNSPDAPDGLVDTGAIGSGRPNAPGPSGIMAPTMAQANPFAAATGGDLAAGNITAQTEGGGYGGGVPAGAPYQSWMTQPGQTYQDILNRNGNPTYANMEWQAYQQFQGLPQNQQTQASATADMTSAMASTPGAQPYGGMADIAAGITGAATNENGSTAGSGPPAASASAGGAGGPGMGAMPTPDQLASFAPRPYQDFGNIPFINPATYDPAQASAAGYSAATYGPAQYSAAQYDPTYFRGVQQGAAGYNAATFNPSYDRAASVDLSQFPGALKSFEGMNAQALAPQFQQQQLSLEDNLGSRGIVNSGASTYLNQNLAGQQDAALASMDAPMIEAMAGYWNQGQETNAQLRQQSGLANQSAQQSAAQANANAINAARATGAGYQEQAIQSNADRAQAAAAANAGAANTAGSTNAAARQAAASENARLRQEAAGANAGAINQANASNAGWQQQTSLDNAQLRQQAAAANAGAQNQASGANAAAYGAVVGSNQQAYNNYEQWLAEQAGTYGQNMLSAYLGSYGSANPAALSTLGSAPGNVGAAYQTGYNAGGGPGLGNAFSALVGAFSRPSPTTSPGSWYSDPNVMQSFAYGGPTSGDPNYD
jgi:hypothetical protein